MPTYEIRYQGSSKELPISLCPAILSFALKKRYSEVGLEYSQVLNEARTYFGSRSPLMLSVSVQFSPEILQEGIVVGTISRILLLLYKNGSHGMVYGYIAGQIRGEPIRIQIQSPDLRISEGEESVTIPLSFQVSQGFLIGSYTRSQKNNQVLVTGTLQLTP